MKKLFNWLAILCGICSFIMAMALDSTTMFPAFICLGCLTYIAIYSCVAFRDAEEIDLDGEDEW